MPASQLRGGRRPPYIVIPDFVVVTRGFDGADGIWVGCVLKDAPFSRDNDSVGKTWCVFKDGTLRGGKRRRLTLKGDEPSSFAHDRFPTVPIARSLRTLARFSMRRPAIARPARTVSALQPSGRSALSLTGRQCLDRGASLGPSLFQNREDKSQGATRFVLEPVRSTEASGHRFEYEPVAPIISISCCPF